jgi:hypothetical protein
MENLNREEIEFIMDALNLQWHSANIELGKKDLGDIERKNWEGVKKKASELMVKLSVSLT